MSAIKITQLPHYNIINANTANTLFLGVDLPTDVTYTFTAHTLAQGLYSNEILNVGSNAVLFSNTVAQFSGSDPTFLQVNQQNFNANGTSDYVLTADTGTNSGGYIDLGINNSKWNPVTAGQTSQYPFDGYLIVNGPGTTPTGNLVLGTSNPSTNVVFAVGGYYANNVVGWMSNTGTVLTRTTTFNAGVVLNPQNIVPPNGLPQSPVLNIVQSANSTVPVFNVNANTGNQSESDFVVLNDQYASQSIYGDFGINSSTYVGTGTGLPFNDANGTYLFSSGGTLSVGTLGTNDLKLITNTTYRLNVNGASGIITVNGTTPATSITTGAVVISGGLGVAGNVYSGGHYITGLGNGITFVDGTTLTTNIAIASAQSFANSAFTKANNALANTTGTFAGDLTVTGNVTASGIQSTTGAISTGNLIVNGTTTTNGTANITGTLNVAGIVNMNAQVVLTNTSFSATQSALTITATPNVAVPSNDGYMVHISGKQNVTSRIVTDSYGTSTYVVYAGRSARGNVAYPTAVQNGDILTRFSGNGYGTTKFQPFGTGRIDFVAVENYTDANTGSQIQFWNCPIGSNTLTQIATFNGSSVTFAGVVQPQKGFIYTPLVYPAAQTAITIDFANNSLVRAQTATGLTVTLSNLLAGKEVVAWITNTAGTNQTFTHGVSATNSTVNSTTYAIPGTSTILARYMSIDGTAQNTFVAITHA